MAEIKLTRGKFAIVDDCVFDDINQYKWYCSAKGYAVRDFHEEGKRKSIRMHRLIMNAKGGEQVDHKNHNKLDNRRENLRICNNQQNHANRPLDKNNTSGFRGVSLHKETGKWRASIQYNGKKISLGLYNNIKKAAEAYNIKARKCFGEFAYQNQINGGDL